MIKKLIIMGILTVPFLLLTRMATAQQGGNESLNVTYQITNPEQVSDLTRYETALKEVNFDGYRLQEKSYFMKFESGLLVEVFSADYLQSIDKLTLEKSSYPVEFSAERYESVFKLTDENQLIELRNISINKKTSR